MYKQNSEADSAPSCFGDPTLFDSSSPECIGGHDPAHFNQNASSPNFRSQIRDQCDWVQACAARVQAKQHLIPVSNLTRNQPPPPQPQPQAQQANGHWATKFNPPTAPQPAQPWRPPSPPAPHTYTPPHMQHMHGPQMMPVNFGIPQYLSVREPQTSGSYGERLFIESLRSMLKSIGHTFAHFFDAEVLGGNRGGGPPQQ